MTSEQKRFIDQYRRQGMGSTEIAEKLSLSVNTVKSYCRRNAVETAATDGGAAPSGICKQCGKLMTGGQDRRGKAACPSRRISEKVLLTNEKYMGDAVLQKTFCTDFLTKKMKKNEGELPQYHVRNSHPAIVSAEVFELVQMEIESRRQYGSRYSGRGVFASKIVCADCGGFFGSKVWHSNDPYRTVIWRCNRKYEKGKRCTTPHVKEEAVKAGFVQVMARLLASKQEVLEGCRQILDEVLTTDEQSKQIAKLQDQAVGLAQRIRGLVNENARTQMTEDEFTPEYDRLVSQYEKLAAKIATIQREKEDKEYRAKRISLFMRMLAGQEECLEFDPAVFTAFVEKVVVSGTKKDIRLRFVLRDGSEYAIEGVTQTISHYRFVPQ